MSLINTPIKPFANTAYKEGKFVDITEADIAGKWAVFFFYPADFTFVCPTELEDLQDNYAELQGMGVEVFGVSTDTHFSHKAWADSSPAIGKITYYLVGDQNHALTNAFDNLRPGVGLADRGTFVVDPDGVIQLIEITPEGVGRNAAELHAQGQGRPVLSPRTPAKSARPSGKKASKTLAPSLDLVGKI